MSQRRAVSPQRRAPGERGQALTELAILLPLLLLLSVGVVDIGSAASIRATVAGAGLAGLRTAQGGAAADVGATIRQQAQASVPNTSAAWGTVYSGAYSCGTGSTSCGDPEGCAPASALWALTPTPRACFAVAACTLTTGPPPSCPAPAAGAWGVRPAAGSSGAVIVKVTFRVVPLTPVVSKFTNGGGFFVTSSVSAVVAY